MTPEGVVHRRLDLAFAQVDSDDRPVVKAVVSLGDFAPVPLTGVEVEGGHPLSGFDRADRLQPVFSQNGRVACVNKRG
jgi:hypothetical protein